MRGRFYECLLMSTKEKHSATKKFVENLRIIVNKAYGRTKQ